MPNDWEEEEEEAEKKRSIRECKKVSFSTSLTSWILDIFSGTFGFFLSNWKNSHSQFLLFFLCCCWFIFISHCCCCCTAALGWAINIYIDNRSRIAAWGRIHEKSTLGNWWPEPQWRQRSKTDRHRLTQTHMAIKKRKFFSYAESRMLNRENKNRNKL